MLRAWFRSSVFWQAVVAMMATSASVSLFRFLCVEQHSFRHPDTPMAFAIGTALAIVVVAFWAPVLLLRKGRKAGLWSGLLLDFPVCCLATEWTWSDYSDYHFNSDPSAVVMHGLVLLVAYQAASLMIAGLKNSNR